jgi:hypothetical protein
MELLMRPAPIKVWGSLTRKAPQALDGLMFVRRT